jgi:hypothetical protein
VTGGKGDCTTLSRNKKEPGAFSLHRDLPGGGVYDCITYGAWGQTSWFLPVKSLFPPHKTLKTAVSVLTGERTCCTPPVAWPRLSYTDSRNSTSADTTREKRDLERKCGENIDILVKVVRCVQSRPASTVDSVLRSVAVQNLLAGLLCTQQTTFT